MSDTITLQYNGVRCDEQDCTLTLEFHPITLRDMPLVWSYLQREQGRTCDFSYGGVLMWVDMFHYEMAVEADTLFIKGRLENDLDKVAFSLPVGSLPLPQAVRLLKKYCDSRGMPLRFSAIPEYSLAEFMALNPRSIALLDGWSDYLYDAAKLASLSGKKMAKKRNHVNQYLNLFGAETYEPLSPANLPDVMAFMDRLEQSADPTPAARQERALARKTLRLMASSQTPMEGGLLRVQGRVVAFTVGDRKGDTLHIHIEKADREVPGAYEMINKAFAADMTTRHPQLRFINREDDAGDLGLRQAKLSYHPLELLKKYNVIF